MFSKSQFFSTEAEKQKEHKENKVQTEQKQEHPVEEAVDEHSRFSGLFSFETEIAKCLSTNMM